MQKAQGWREASIFHMFSGDIDPPRKDIRYKVGRAR